MQKEQLSAYIDGELVNAELTKKLCQDKALQTAWANFHTIRAVMRKESAVLLGADFTAKMETLIASESVHLNQLVESQPLPQEVEKSPFVQKLKAMFMPLAQISVAASVCLVAVLGTQSVLVANKAGQDIAQPQVLQTLPFNSQVQEVSYNPSVRETVSPEQLEKRNKRVNAMLQNYEIQRRVHADVLQHTDK